MLIYFILRYLTLSTLTQARLDYTHDVTSTTGSNIGEWKNKVFCPDDTYIYSYNQLQDCTSVGTNYIKVLCSNIDHSSGNSEINSYLSPPITVGTWQTQKSCGTYDFFFSYYVSKNALYQGNQLGMNNVKMKCTNGGNYLSPGGGCTQNWSSLASCNQGEVFCGYQLKYDDNVVAGDDLLFMCCLICKKHQGFYLATINSISSCMFCYAYCKTCSDMGPNNCLSCYSEDTQNDSTCLQNAEYYEVINAFSGATFSNADSYLSNFSSDLATITTTECYGKSWVGGYQIFGVGNRLSYVLKNQPPHFKLRIKAKFLKIDKWNLNSLKILVDGTMQKIPEISKIDEKYGKLYFGNQCGGGGPEDIIVFDYIMNHKTNADSTITFTSDLSKSAAKTSWGVRDIIIGIYKCHFSCMTCTGPKDLDCIECYPQASKVNGLCTCNDNLFLMVSSSPCTTYPCSKCNQCAPGCKTCTSNQNNACSSCMTGYFLSTNMCVTQCLSPLWGEPVSRTCVISCLSTQFANENLRTCDTCDVSCSTCQLSTNICTTCATNYFRTLNSGPCQICDVSCLTCQTTATNCITCATNYFSNPNSNPGNCEKCSNNCLTCGTTSINCLTCLTNYFKTNTNMCEICDATCLTCEIIATNCLTCPSNYFKNVNSGLCEMCDATCLTCQTTATNCIICATNYFKDVLTNLCVLKCPDGYYGDSLTMKCELCDLDCSTCSGEKNLCTSCASSYTLNSDTCSMPTFYSQIDTQLTTTSSFSSHTFIIDSPLLISNQCTYDCGTSTILGGIDCMTQGSSILQTYSDLAPHYSIQIKFYFYKIDFWNQNNLFVNIDGNNKHSIFLTKDDPGNFLCGNANEPEARRAVNFIRLHSSTSIQIKLYTDLSVSSNVASWGITDFSFALLICHDTCLTCSGELESNCLSCQSPLFLQGGICVTQCSSPLFGEAISRTCVSSCPSTQFIQFIDASLSVCAFCDLSCETCVANANNCITCASHYFMMNASPKTCQECDISCSKCETTTTNCLACASHYYSKSNSGSGPCDICDVSCLTCETTEFTCLECGTNYFKNVNVGPCEKCDATCLTCQTTATNCITCSPDAFRDVLTNRCAFNCPNGYYGDLITMKCKLCNLDCSACSGGKDLCTSCASSYTLNGNTCSMPTSYMQIETQLTTPSSFHSHTFTIESSLSTTNGFQCIYYCGIYLILGGENCLTPGSSILKTYSTLRPHYSIQIKFYLVKIDTWLQSKFFVNIDNNDIADIILSNENDPENFLCGQTNIPEARRAVNLVIPHSSTSIQIKLYSESSSSNSNIPLWGMSDFSFVLLICHDTCLTCSGELMNNCLTCQSPLFLLEGKCITGCPEPFVGQPSTNKCETACASNENYDILRICRLCLLKVLNKDFQNLCLENCGIGYYQDSNNCIQCSENCNKCNNTSCLECNSLFYLNLQNGKCFSSCQKDINLNQLYFNNITQTCDKDCPPSTFPNNSTKTCWPCDSKCTKCFGLSIDECNSCVDKYFIQNSSCVDSCSTGYFFNEQGKTCEKCMILKCMKCPNANSCLECQSGLLVMRPKNDSCTACDKLNYYKEVGYCSECSANCILCESADRCQTCLSGYYLSAGKCLAQKLIKAQLVYDSMNPFRIHLKFDNYWKNGFDMLLSKIQIKINYLNADLYSYVLKKNEKDNTDFFMDFSFKCNITLGTKLNLKVVGQLPTQDEYNITIREYELPLNEFYQCPDGNVYNVTTKSCYQAIMVTPILEYSDNLDELIFRFNPDFDSLFQVIPNNTFVSILGINFTYNFIPSKQKSYVIKFIFNNSFTNKPVCTLYITIPPQILYNSSNLLTLESNIVSIAMRNYYVMDNSLKNTIENAKKTTEQMSSVSSTATMGNSFLSFGSSMAISIMMSMEIIRFLKYLNIDYPPNVDGMFKSSQRGEGLIPDILIDVDNEEKATLPYTFTNYKTSIYSFNNSGNILIENLFYIGLGALILFIHKIFESKIASSTIVSKIFDFFLYMLVWNFSITYFLGVYLNYIFFSLLSFKFPCSASSEVGKLNIIYSAILFVVIFLTIIFFWWKIRSSQLNRKEGDNSIFPEQNTIPISKSEIYNNLSKDNSSNTNNTNSITTQGNLKVINLEGSPTETKHLFTSENSQPKKQNINKNFLIEDIILPPNKEIEKRESLFSRLLRGRSTAIQKVFDSIGGPKRIMNKVINNFFRGKGATNIPPFKSLSSDSTPSVNSVKKKTRFDCLNNGLNHSNRGQTFYILFDVMRQTLIAFMIVFLFDNPIAATGMINFINFNFFVLIIFIQPQKAKLDLIQTVFNELCVNLACFAAMALAIMERTGNTGDPTLKFNVGWIIVGANITFMVVFLGRFFLTFCLAIGKHVVKIYKKHVENRKNSKSKETPTKNAISPLYNDDLVVSSVEEGVDGHLKEGEAKK